MVTLFYQTEDQSILDVKERLKDLSLAYKAESSIDMDIPYATEGDQRFEGIKAINEFIDLLASESHNWWYCDC